MLLKMLRNFLRRVFAKYLLAKITEGIGAKKVVLDKLSARKWNHLQAIIITKGNIKFDWDTIRGIERPRCKRCLKHLSMDDVEHCPSCKKIINS